jgi:hypothetical protein
MHIHSNPISSQMLANATQGTQQAAAARREAMAVRKKLTDFAAATDDSEDVSRVAYDPSADSGSRQNQNPQSEEESFKSIYFSLKV